VWAGLAIASVFVAGFERWRRTQGGLGAEAVVLVMATSLALIGIFATLLTCFDSFGPWTMAMTCSAIALLTWPWGVRRPPAAWRRPRLAAWVAPVLLVGGGLALRLPISEYALAGRDQGTYTLRAMQTLRS
jgi:hypothetical protein